jgi:uncharacterized protein YlbG (UPF0298 family)
LFRNQKSYFSRHLAGVYVNKKEKYIVLNSQTLQQINEKISAKKEGIYENKSIT